ncbi:MAG: CBS domain-containing protein [Desulfobacteraceae bacterium]|nr:CBS domain-containing protein [Desulfobacteraceae bacterium]
MRISIILPAGELGHVLSAVQEMMADGIVAVRDLEVVAHKTRGQLLSRSTRVRAIMTPSPKKVGVNTPLDEVARLLLSSTFTGLPVVNEENRPVGVITQGDLIYKAGIPMRLGLLARAENGRTSAVLEALGARRADEIMTRPAVVINQDKPLTEAVNLMLARNVKRLPVVDEVGELTGILSRVDVFRTVVRECPDWRSFQRQSIQVAGLRTVADIERRDVATVLPNTPVDEVVHVIDCHDIQRVCVVDREGRFLGLITDRDLLIGFADRHPGIWDYFAGKIPFTDQHRLQTELREHLAARTAADVMKTKIVTVQEETSIEEAVRLMIEHAIKRLPVVDAEGKFKGMISRDSLLRTGFASL